MRIQKYLKPPKELRGNRYRQTRMEEQLRDQSRFICKLYQCVACKSIKPIHKMKYYYPRDEARTLVYAGGKRKAIPCVCFTCCKSKRKEKWFKKQVGNRKNVRLIPIWDVKKNKKEKNPVFKEPWMRDKMTRYWKEKRRNEKNRDNPSQGNQQAVAEQE